MSISNSFSCFIVGNGAVALRCGELLHLAGHQIQCVYSFDDSLRQWALGHNIVHADSLKDFQQSLLSQHYDFLFSINNPWIIPAPILALAGRLTINFHDSPLPRYAGLHATSWALINGETQHGTCWHEVVPDIDAGRILKQVVFDVAKDDTALTLNRRVLELTVDSFAQLLAELAVGDEQFTEQAKEEGSYYSLTDRPDGACLLCFKQPAITMANLVRGLNFGSLYNPLGLAKLLLPGESACVAVSGFSIIADQASMQPGTVLSVTDEGIGVSAIDADVLLSGLCSLEGKALSGADLKSLACVAGSSLPVITESQRGLITQYNRQVCKQESFWRQRLAKLLPLEHPFSNTAKSAPNAYSCYTLGSLLPYAGMNETLLSIYAAYLLRTGNRECFDVGLLLNDIPDSIQCLFSAVVPMQIPDVAVDDESFAAFSQRFEDELNRCRAKGGVSRDLLARDPVLRAQSSRPQLAISLGLLNCPDDLDHWRLESPMTLLCFRDASPAQLCHQGVLQPWQEQAIDKQLACLASACVKTPETPVYQLPLITAAEREAIVYQWNDTQSPFPHTLCVDELISRQVQRTPEAIAVKFGQQCLSYGQLEERSNQLACVLIQRGVQSGDLVVLCLPRSLDLIVSLLAIIKSGAAYTPVDCAYPRERIQYLLEDSGATCVVTTNALQHEHFSTYPNVVCIDGEEKLICTADCTAVHAGVDPEALLYVIYTSGSTGKPKGVSISHRSLINHSWAIAEIYSLGCDDCMLQSASIGFDVAAEQIFPALFKGSCVFIRPDNLFESFRGFERFITEQGISVMALPTAFWHEWSSDLHLNNRAVPGSLRALGVGTEKVTAHNLKVWEGQCKERNVAFFQGYGPSETTVTCCMYRHEQGATINSEDDIPIGRALPNVKLYVFGENMDILPVGFVGELFIGGSGVAKGYHRRDELTQQRFITNPFEGSNERLYKTGDLVRWNPDGQLVFVGRSDFQIKVRGNRVELGEIEAALQACDGVKQVIVHPGKDKDGDQHLIAYVLAEAGTAPDTQHLL
ncbi:MAG: amino acid adenylation domain-containing protein, partial [Spongiibacteraceae bacterium]|nr:amino acid adenylation domain-containing protein [Spongiibacteraceae bacterium]